MLRAIFKPIRKASIPTLRAITHLAISLLLFVSPSVVVSPSTSCLLVPPAAGSVEALGDGLTDGDGEGLGDEVGEAEGEGLGEGSVDGDGLGLGSAWAKADVANANTIAVEAKTATVDLLKFIPYLD